MTRALVKVIFASEEPVKRFSPEGPYWEALVMAGADTRDFVGAPVLDAHDNYSVRSVLGYVQDYKIRGRAGVATLNVGGEFADRLLETPQDFRGISVGYSVQKVQARADLLKKLPVLDVTRWTPREVSIVGVQLDPFSRVLEVKKL